jgi:DNA-binding GntR family transcriptional regulator
MKQVTDVKAALRKAIISGQFMPNERLIEVELAARFVTTRAQIRNALGALEGEGLVVSEPNRGARVRLVTGAEAVEITEVRAALETLVVAKAAERASVEDIARLEDILARMRTANAADDLIGYSALNGELHSEICRISRHASATKLLLLLNSQSIRFQFRAILIPGRAAKSLAEHEVVVDAIKSHDPVRAHDAMRQHLAQVIDTLRHAIVAQEILPGLAVAPDAAIDGLKKADATLRNTSSTVGP